MKRIIAILIITVSCTSTNKDDFEIQNEGLMVRCELECYPKRYFWNYNEEKCVCEKEKAKK